MRSILIALAAATAMTASLPAYAQQKPANPGAAVSVPIPRGVFFRGQIDGQILSSDNLIGAKIYDKDGKIVADIEELILTSDLRVEGVIIGTGGFLGAKSASACVSPLCALRLTARLRCLN